MLAGGDTNGGKAPGNIVHHEMATFAEAGFTPMQVIQSATKWPAETLKVQDKIGTIEAGKLADLVIVNADPLQDVTNLHKIDSVVFDGKVVERTYHPWFSSPFTVTGLNESHAVESLPWVATLKQATFRGGSRRGGAAPDPAPIATACARNHFSGYGGGRKPDAQPHAHGVQFRGQDAGLL